MSESSKEYDKIDLASVLQMKAARRRTYDNPVVDFEVYDGDTIKGTVDVGYNMHWKGGMRVLGTDTPEVRTSASFHKEVGRKVRDVTVAWCHSGQEQGLQLRFISEVKPKFAGRAIGTLYFANATTNLDNLGEFLLKHGIARSYDGGPRPEWTYEELVTCLNRCEKLLDGFYQRSR